METISLTDFVAGLPKAELHIHVEGSLEPDLLFALAERNGVGLRHPDVDSLRAAYAFNDLQSFLDIYYQGAAVLVTEQDFYDLMTAYLSRAHADGVRRSEIFFDPQTHTDRGIEFSVFMSGFVAAISDAQRDLGISADLIMCFLRHLGPEAAMATFEEASPFHSGLLGVGLDSSEVGYPPEPFAPVFDRAAGAGLHRVAHAGEEGPPAFIWGALDTLGVERIDHGVRSEEDPALIDRLVAEDIALTVCPLSNLALKVFDNLGDHNLKRLLDRGVKVTINSDDPAYFGGHIAQNYLATASALDLSRDELAKLARNSFEAAFVADEERAGWIGELDQYLANVGQPD